MVNNWGIQAHFNVLGNGGYALQYNQTFLV